MFIFWGHISPYLREALFSTGLSVGGKTSFWRGVKFKSLLFVFKPSVNDRDVCLYSPTPSRAPWSCYCPVCGSFSSLRLPVSFASPYSCVGVSPAVLQLEEDVSRRCAHPGRPRVQQLQRRMHVRNRLEPQLQQVRDHRLGPDPRGGKVASQDQGELVLVGHTHIGPAGQHLTLCPPAALYLAGD